MNALVTEIEKVVREASAIIMEAKRTEEMVSSKEGHANFVTTYDKAVQDYLKKNLLALLPEAVFVGEEEDMHMSVGKGYAFIVDPIDGTTNFIRNMKASCISVGLLQDGAQYIGVIYNPYLDEMFSAEKGCGAFLNGEQIHVSNAPLSEGIIIFGTAPYYEELCKKSFEMAYELCKKGLDVRRSGSAAIDLCNIACGRAELFFELRLSPWDYAAGSLIVREAGGKVVTAEGGEITFDSPCSIVAGNAFTIVPLGT